MFLQTIQNEMQLATKHKLIDLTSLLQLFLASPHLRYQFFLVQASLLMALGYFLKKNTNEVGPSVVLMCSVNAHSKSISILISKR